MATKKFSQEQIDQAIDAAGDLLTAWLMALLTRLLERARAGQTVTNGYPPPPADQAAAEQAKAQPEQPKTEQPHGHEQARRPGR